MDVAIEDNPGGGYVIHILSRGFVAAANETLCVSDMCNAKVFQDPQQLSQYCAQHDMNIKNGSQNIINGWKKFHD